MMTKYLSFVPLLLCFLAIDPALADWPQFRGVNSSSIGGDAPVPVAWDDPENFAWRIDLPGRGPSSPIVVNGRVILTATTGYRHDRLHVLCYDAQTGAALWQRQFWATGRTATHDSVTGAAPTPASDGRYVYAFYSSNDLVCLDLDGNLQWYRGLSFDYPKSGNDVGMASSPVVVDGVVVVQIESQSESFGTGIDAETGETRWHIDRLNRPSWSSPVVLPGQGQRKTAVVLQSCEQLTAHDPQTGEELWRIEDSCAGIASSVPHENRLYVPMKGLTALRFSDQSNSPEILWNSNRLGPGSSSPLVYDGRVYVLSNASVRCGDANTGELLWAVRLKGRYWATPVLTGGHLFCINEEGDASVVKIQDDGGVEVAKHQFGETIHASPAVADGAVFVRSDRHLWKIAR